MREAIDYCIRYHRALTPYRSVRWFIHCWTDVVRCGVQIMILQMRGLR